MSDHNWRTFFLGAGGYSPWLRDHGSLTRRIQHRCSQFEVKNRLNTQDQPMRDELRTLCQSRAQQVYTREVFLLADGQAVVFAHSVVALHHLRSAWQPVQHLGSKPLGAMLFAHPLVKRAPLRYRRLDRRSELYRRATQGLPSPPERLWARRSIFQLHGAPLLVTEIFLPAILRLPQ